MKKLTVPYQGDYRQNKPIFLCLRCKQTNHNIEIAVILLAVETAPKIYSDYYFYSLCMCTYNELCKTPCGFQNEPSKPRVFKRPCRLD